MKNVIQLALLCVFLAGGESGKGLYPEQLGRGSAARADEKPARPADAPTSGNPLTLVVMDPLAAPLACDCVQGYAQRKYEELGTFLTAQLGREVGVVWAESLEAALEKSTGGADLIVGKHSVVISDAKEAGIAIRPLARLTDLKDRVDQTGLIVVRSDDPAQKVDDLQGYRILFGPVDCDEKSAAPMALLKERRIALPTPLETAPSCSNAALALMEMGKDARAAAVISSYAEPLLEGCGKVKKGDLRVIGESKPVPFITLFVRASLAEQVQRAIAAAIDEVGLNAQLLVNLETATGFVPWEEEAHDDAQAGEAAPEDEAPADAADSREKKAKDVSSGNGDWPGWRGARRDAQVAWLPEALPRSVDFEWTAKLAGEGIGGVAAAQGYVVVGSRDALDRMDVFQCFDAHDGTLAWQHAYPAEGDLDYGNSPRATPLIEGDYVFTLSALGRVCCLELATGILLWQVDLVETFDAPELIWGHSGTPLLAGNKLIVQPGSQRASLAALDIDTGEVIWQTPGLPPGYSSLLLMNVRGTEQIVGYDAASLGGWDVETGRRLWTVVPARKGDFNVPTLVALGDRLLASTENNGTRVYGFRDDGALDPKPLLENDDLRPDAHTPVVCNGRVFGISSELYELDPGNNLETVSASSDKAFGDYGALIASDARLLAFTHEGELALIAANSAPPKIVSRLKLCDADSPSQSHQGLSHPALAGTALYVRLGTTLTKLDLAR